MNCKYCNQPNCGVDISEPTNIFTIQSSKQPTNTSKPEKRTMMIDKNDLILIFQKSLLFNISKSTRIIAAYIQNNDSLIIEVYFDRIPSDDEKDLYYAVSAEVTGDIDFLDEAKSKVIFSIKEIKDKELKGKLVLFARCDYMDENN